MSTFAWLFFCGAFVIGFIAGRRFDRIVAWFKKS